jgi:hypothetical protein
MATLAQETQRIASPLISIREVRKSYQLEEIQVDALRGVDLEIESASLWR